VEPIGAAQPVQAAAPAPAAAATAAQAPAAAAPAQSAGAVRVEAQVAGKIWKVPSTVGQDLQPGDSIVILESMKMEIPVVAPSKGRITSINVSEGDAVEVGDLIATMN